ncbi:MAG TPA: type II toxin-antitoxin system prevent-host-death family antitoxin [Pirellulales bacterium]|jgi:prevent-host-death family protein|nr:type II toxin-antitoxin system prevent-host-death family antitoxin [Pirellulales bacterium]
MKSASAARIAAQFNRYLEASREQPVLITRDGEPIAVLLAVQGKADAKRLVSGGPRMLTSILAEAHEQLGQGRGIPHDQFWREVERAHRAKRAKGATARSRRRPS